MNRHKFSFSILIFCIGLLVASISWSQHPARKSPKTNDSAPVVLKESSGLSDPLNTRAVLIKELKKLGVAFASNDRNQIRLIFQFPVSDSILSLGTTLDDSAFRVEYEKNHGLTEKMFENYFRKLHSDWRLNELNKLFKYLPLDSLRQKDSLSYFAIKEKEPCLKQYFLTVSDSLVMITYGTNGNLGFKGKKSDDEVGDECEYDTIWEFFFDGKTLVFKWQNAAG